MGVSKLLVGLCFLLMSLSLVLGVTPSNLEVYELGDDGFVIGWQTDEPSTSQILYGSTGRLGDSSSRDSTLKTDHQVQVDGLNPGTVYFFRATGTNNQGEQYYSVIGVTRTTNSGSSDDSSDTATDSFYIGNARSGNKEGEVTGIIDVTQYPDATLLFEPSETPNYVEFTVEGQTFRENGAPWGIMANLGEWVTKSSHTIVVRAYGSSGILETKEITLSFSNYEGGSDDQVVIDELKAFPSAEGWGKYATGGRGGRVIYVTNLNDAGSGSLRSALEASGPRTVLFKVGGTISVSSPIAVGNGQLTLDGASAPGDGITIKRDGSYGSPALTVSSSDVIIRNIRIRAGPGRAPECCGDSVGIGGGAQRVIFDKMSLSWATDEIWSPWGNTQEITLQNSVISEALMYSTHSYSTDTSHSAYRNPHSMGVIVGAGATKISFYRNLFAHNNQRNPLVGGDSPGSGEVELVQNVVYNHQYFGTVLSDPNVRANVINNVHIDGPNTRTIRRPIMIGTGVEIYVNGNRNYFRTSDSMDQWTGIGVSSNNGQSEAPKSQQKSSPFNFPLADASILSRDEVLDLVLEGVGAQQRDSVDARIVNDVRTKQGGLIDDPSEVGGWPNLASGTPYTDSDNDGIEDSWELNIGGQVGRADNNGDHDGDGYTNLEEFLHYLNNEAHYGTSDTGTDVVITPDPDDFIDASFGVDFFYETQGRTRLDTVDDGDTITISTFNDLAIQSFGNKLETVLYYVNGQYVQTQNDFPVTLDKQYFSTPGQYTIEAVPYDQDSPSGENNALGTRGVSKTITVSVVAGTNPPDPEPNPTPTPQPDDGDLKAFPSAYGGGSEVSGGRGGVLIKVNTLDFDKGLTRHPKSGSRDEYYTGSLNAALKANDLGPRYVVFDVSGVIQGNGKPGAESRMLSSAKDITIFGQSAPRGGITLYKTFIHVWNGENIIIRYLRSRPGVAPGNPIPDDRSSTPFKINAHEVILDHVTATWGGDKAIIVSYWSGGIEVRDITVQNALMADSHTLGFSVDGVNTDNQYDKGGDVSYIYNFFAGPSHRTPNIGGFNGHGEAQNNVIQNKASRMINVNYGYPKINHVGNWHRFYGSNVVKNVNQPRSDSKPSIYTANNYYRNNGGVILTGANGEDNTEIWADFYERPNLVDRTIFTTTNYYGRIKNPAPLLTPQEAKQKVLDGDVGANKYIDNNGRVQFFQDSYDAARIEDLRNDRIVVRKHSSDWVLPDLPRETRPSSYDTDNDGMSDAWERRTFGDLDESYRGDHDGDGYTNIEEFMNQVDYFTR